MDYKAALEYINGVSWLGSKPGLERVRVLLTGLGNPEKKLKFVHVAGTNGKGSICSYLASVLKTAGYKTGLFTSPYIARFNERMKINGKEIGDAELASIVEQIKPVAEAMEDHPTEFEMMTAAALLWFEQCSCDIVVLEVGLGGRFDATNIIPCPDCAVIANIGLDHTAILGNTPEEIASEKAGIIKPGCTAVMYQQQGEVMRTVRDICDGIGAELRVPDFDDITSEFNSREGQVFSYSGENYAISLLGEHQLYNAVTAIEAVEVLREKGWEIPHEALEAGLYSTQWPARFEIVQDEPWFVVDGGHNPQCAVALADALKQYFPDEKKVLLIGMLKDKDCDGVLNILAPLFEAFVTVTPDSERALSAEDLGKKLEKFGKPVSVIGSVSEGVREALNLADELGAMVCSAGSLYICGEVRACFCLK